MVARVRGSEDITALRISILDFCNVAESYLVSKIVMIEISIVYSICHSLLNMDNNAPTGDA